MLFCFNTPSLQCVWTMIIVDYIVFELVLPAITALESVSFQRRTKKKITRFSKLTGMNPLIMLYQRLILQGLFSCQGAGESQCNFHDTRHWHM